jgi:phosphate transport system substrate-binding protein
MPGNLHPVARALLLLSAAVVWLTVAPGNGIGATRFLAAAETSSPPSLAIVVNRANPVENLSSVELRHIFLGERSHWPNGRRITLVMMEPGEPERETLLREVCRMSEKEFNNHFLHGLFTGEVFATPKTLASPVGVRKFVFNVPGAIGYLRPADVDDSVKVVRIDGLLPGDKDYKIQILARSAK